jgi:hypothetical protein
MGMFLVKGPSPECSFERREDTGSSVTFFDTRSCLLTPTTLMGMILLEESPDFDATFFSFSGSFCGSLADVTTGGDMIEGDLCSKDLSPAVTNFVSGVFGNFTGFSSILFSSNLFPSLSNLMTVMTFGIGGELLGVDDFESDDFSL